MAAMTLACCTAGRCMSPALDNGTPVPQNAPFVIYTDDQGQVFTYVLLHVCCKLRLQQQLQLTKEFFKKLLENFKKIKNKKKLI